MTELSKEKKLVDSLITKTDQGKIAWSENPVDGSPIVKIGTHIVMLEEGRSSNGASLISVIVIDENGKELDRFNDEDLDRNTRTSDYFVHMTALYNRASKQARGAEKAIDDILKNIDSL